MSDQASHPKKKIMTCGEFSMFCLTFKVPKLAMCVAITLLIVNIIFPGWGTLVAGLINGGNKRLHYVFIFLIQFFLCWLVVPWIWSVLLGALMVGVASGCKCAENKTNTDDKTSQQGSK